MAFIPVPNTAQVELKFLYGFEIIENTLWFENIIDPTEAMLSALCLSISEKWGEWLSPHQSADVSLYNVRATSMTDEESPIGEVFPLPPVSGEVESPAMPSSVTWTIRFRTAARGRSFRGRNYWIGLTESQVQGNAITSTLANNIADGYSNFISEVAVDGWQHVIASRFSGGAPRETGVTTPVNGYGYADLFVDSQRRRLTGRGS